MAHSDRYDRRTFLARGASVVTAAALAGAGGVLLESCSSGSSPSLPRVANPGVGVGSPRRGGNVTIGLNSEIDGFLPSMDHWDNSGYVYANSVYDSLAVIGADGSAQPYLAQSVTANPDMTVWTVTLRPGVVFHDGSPLNAAVVVANFEALRQSALTSAAITPITGVVASGSLEVTYTCDEPLVAFPYYLSTQVGYIIAMAQLKKANSTHPIGTGPFVYQSWEPNDHFTVTRNPHYWRNALPYVDSITYKPIVSDQSRQASLQAGTIDMMVSRDPVAIADLRHNPSFQQINDLKQTTGEPDMDFIILNTAVAPLNDLVVRQALAYATDAAEISRIFGQGITTPATSPFPVGSPYHNPDNGYPTYNLQTAKALVAQARPSHGGKLVIGLDTITDPRDLSIVQALQSMWQAAGFTVSIGQVQEVALIDSMALGTFEAYTDEQFSAPDPDINYVFWSSTTAPAPGEIALNFSRNSDPTLEAALQKGRTSSDPATRAQAYQAVDLQLARDLPYLWLSQATWSATASNRVLNFANPTLPAGGSAQGFSAGAFMPTQIWLAA